MLLRILSAGLGPSHLLKNTPNPPNFLHWFSSPPEILCAQTTNLILWVAAGVNLAGCTGKNLERSKADTAVFTSNCINEHISALFYLSSFCLRYAVVVGMGYDYSCHADCWDFGLFMPG